MSRLPRLSSDLCHPRRVARLRAAFWAVEDALRTRAARTAFALPAARQAPAPAPPARPHAMAATDRARVLRWVFARGEERLTCELALSSDTAWYELRTTPSTRPASQTIERYTDVSAAFERQSALEGSLVGEGWSLEAYESLVVEREVDPPAGV